MLGKARYKIGLLIDLLENIEELIFEIRKTDDSKELIIHLNTEKQLYLGKKADESSLPDYTNYTISLKKIDGLPSDRMTLSQTGDFYESFSVVVRQNETVIIADTIKENDVSGSTDLAKRYGEILGLNEENKAFYRAWLLPLILQALRNNIRAIAG